MQAAAATTAGLWAPPVVESLVSQAAAASAPPAHPGSGTVTSGTTTLVPTGAARHPSPR